MEGNKINTKALLGKTWTQAGKMKLEIGGMAQDAIPTEAKSKNRLIPKMQNLKTTNVGSHIWDISSYFAYPSP